MIAVRLYHSLPEHRLTLVAILLLLLLEALMGSLSISMLVPLTAAVTSGGDTRSWPLNSVPEVLLKRTEITVGIFGLLLTGKAALSWIRMALTVRFAERLRRAWQCEMAERLLHQSYARFVATPRGVLIENLTRQTDFGAMFVLKWLSYTAQAVILGSLVVTFLVVSWQAAVVVAAAAALLWMSAGRPYFRWSHELGVRSVKLNQALMTDMTATLAGIKEVKVTSGEAMKLADIGRKATEVMWNRIRTKLASEMPTYGAEFGVGIIVIGVAGFFWLSGREVAEILPLLVFMLGSGIRIAAAASNVVAERFRAFNKLYAFDVVMKELAASSSQAADEVGPAAGAPRREIRFEAVGFSYPRRGGVADDENASVIRNASFAIPAGSFTCLFGPSGAGKTTIVDLLMRLYEPTAGRILADDTEIRTFSVASWRRQLGYVAQEPTLFLGSIKQNITMGRTDLSDEEVLRACRIAQLDEFLAQLPRGLDTSISDAGANLSGGQKRRIALARALVRRPSLLILDEATGALDEHMERTLLDSLRGVPGLAVLVISHRSVTARWVDHVLRIDRGEVIEESDSEGVASLPRPSLPMNG